MFKWELSGRRVSTTSLPRLSHLLRLHLRVWIEDPLQGLLVASHDRPLCWVPVPQVTVHSVHSDQGDQPSSLSIAGTSKSTKSTFFRKHSPSPRCLNGITKWPSKDHDCIVFIIYVSLFIAWRHLKIPQQSHWVTYILSHKYVGRSYKPTGCNTIVVKLYMCGLLFLRHIEPFISHSIHA